MNIFLIGGKAGSGKSEIAKYIKEYYIYQKKDVAITEYSKYLKSFARELTDWDGMATTKPRDFLQEIGTYIRSEMGEHKFFVNRMLEDFEIYEHYVDAVAVSDVRYPLEITAIKEQYPDAIAIYVENQFGQSNLTIEQQMHPSETALEEFDGFDYTIANDDPNTLRDKVFKILEGLK